MDCMTLTQAIAELKFKDDQIAELVRQIEGQNRRIEELRQQIALFQRRLYGLRAEVSSGSAFPGERAQGEPRRDAGGTRADCYGQGHGGGSPAARAGGDS